MLRAVLYIFMLGQAARFFKDGEDGFGMVVLALVATLLIVVAIIEDIAKEKNND